ncbi:MAG: tRNA (N6-isopentenyl adenosine(37)-C2)-methylthiotransferase MiaB [Bacteroidales bacterium]|nr:tRNA (N6-isopentenyl adenosine(37)-C2)-methylthiotransferase MiaB [Candidatus Cacconaster scatequi]
MSMRVFIETYGCQMNVSDSEVVLTILGKVGYSLCDSISQADVILVNTCSVRDNAEQRILGRLDVFRMEKKKRSGVIVGVLGCMAQRMKEELLKHPVVDIVAGPDSYRNLPAMIDNAARYGKQMDTTLSRVETYADILPTRVGKSGVSAYISIMRGCNNVCSYCIVPFTRGSERSREPESILKEAKALISNGYREISLLGQNVDSYRWTDPESGAVTVDFADLLEKVALLDPRVRIRFSTSHPKDMSDKVLHTMARHDNICKHIHLPVQSGSSVLLEKMNRKYTREHYLERIGKIHEILPDCAITTDVIAGFCSETEEDHALTISLFKEVRFDGAFMFQYSERPGTKASRRYPDDVPLQVKTARLNEIIALQNAISLERNQECIGKSFEVLVEGRSKRSDKELVGRTSQNKTCVFPDTGLKPGDYATVMVDSCSSATLICRVI